MKKKQLLIYLTASALTIGVVAPFGVHFGKKISSLASNYLMAKGTEKQITISYPQQGQNVTILRRQVVDYIAAMHKQAEAIENDYIIHDFYASPAQSDSNPAYGTVYENDTDKVKIADYYGNTGEYGKSKSVYLTFDTKGFEDNATYTVKIGRQSDLSDAKVIETQDEYAIIHNMYANETYYWSVESGGVNSGIHSFVTNEGFRMISSGGVTNVRDMGGRPVMNGKHIKQGLIFRGAELVRADYVPTDSSSTHHKTLDEEALNVFQNELQIGYEFDLRGDAESGNLTESPLKDEGYTDVQYARIPNMSAYNGFFDMSDEQKARVANMFRAFGDAENRHCYFHCWGGADRTGTIGFMLGALLGMSYTDLIIDFELTSFSNNYRPHNVVDAKKIYLFPRMIWKLKNMQEYKNNPNITISELVEALLVNKFGMTHEEIAQIKNNLLEDQEVII